MTSDPAGLPGPRKHRQPRPERGPGDDAIRDARLATAALEFRCRQITGNLRDALGADGCAALLARAMAECEPRHPVLRQMRGPDEREVQLGNVAAAVAAHGIAAVDAAVEALVGSLVGILARLIGEDMALRLIGLDGSDGNPDGQGS